MRTRRQLPTTIHVNAHWCINHWELTIQDIGTAYLAPDDNFETHLEHFLNQIGHHPQNPTFHIHYPQAIQE
jgi:hypothetical protein